MKNVMMLVHDDVGQEARLQVALDLVDALDGHLICVDAMEIPDRSFQAFGGPIATMVLEQAAANERRNKSELQPRLDDKGVRYAWLDANEPPDVALVRHGRLADLVVVNTVLSGVEFPNMAALTRNLVTALHAPVLAVPEKCMGLRASGAALLLWDGSPDAEAAMCAAVPLLQMASTVTVLSVETGKPALPAREAVEYLRRHDIVSHVSQHEVVGKHPAFMIERFIRRHEPAYVVMGAFGQSRLHEAIFGSTTGLLMDKSPVPLLLARRA